LDREYRNQNMKAYAKLFDKVAEFDKKYPSYAISDSISASLGKREEQRGMSYHGVVPSERNEFLLGAMKHVGQRAAEAEKRNKQP